MSSPDMVANILAMNSDKPSRKFGYLSNLPPAREVAVIAAKNCTNMRCLFDKSNERVRAMLRCIKRASLQHITVRKIDELKILSAKLLLDHFDKPPTQGIVIVKSGCYEKFPSDDKGCYAPLHRAQIKVASYEKRTEFMSFCMIDYSLHK